MLQSQLGHWQKVPRGQRTLGAPRLGGLRKCGTTVVPQHQEEVQKMSLLIQEQASQLNLISGILIKFCRVWLCRASSSLSAPLNLFFEGYFNLTTSRLKECKLRCGEIWFILMIESNTEGKSGKSSGVLLFQKRAVSQPRNEAVAGKAGKIQARIDTRVFVLFSE